MILHGKLNHERSFLATVASGEYILKGSLSEFGVAFTHSHSRLRGIAIRSVPGSLGPQGFEA